MNNFKILLKSKIIGVLFVILAFLSLISLITYDPQDSGFGITGTSLQNNNFLGILGSYFSSFMMVFFSHTSYILIFFFGFYGFRFLLTSFKKNIYLKIFYLTLGVLLTNLSIELWGLGFSLVGNILENITYSVVGEYKETLYFIEVLAVILSALSFVLILLSLDLKMKALYFFILKTFHILIIILLPFKKFFKLNNRIKEKKQIIRKNLKKQEPTFYKNKKNYIFKSNTKENNLDSKENFKYVLPPINLLRNSNEKKESLKEIEKRNSALSIKLEETLQEYGVEGRVRNYKTGPVVTLFEFVPAAGIKTSKIVGLADDIARAMSSVSTRIASQPGKTSIGIEIPNKIREGVFLGDLISSDEFLTANNGITLALGKNISGEKKFTDLEKMPHLLIAGTTGSGKSVGINSMIVSILYRFTPSECKLILIDPKMLELSIYADIPHLLTPVVTNPQKAVFALKWVVREMENRYKLMSSINVKNIKSYNEKILSARSTGRKLYREVQTGIDKETRKPIIEKKEILLEKMPLIVVVIDEMADLMMVAGKEVENLVQRLAQMARASGIHIVAATQRPSVDVITGTIKANFPSRISFRVASRFDSRTILNEMGAEQLLGSGDMLFLENGANINRLHGGFVSELEIESVVKHIKLQKTNETQEDITIENSLKNEQRLDLGFEDKNVDELYDKAIDIVIEQQKVSTSFIQRYLQIGYNRAARIVEKMEEDGYITEANNSGKRSVIKKNR